MKNGATVTWQQGANKSVVVPESAKVEVTDTWREGPTNFKVVEAAMAALAAPAAAASAPSTPATAPKTPINVPSAITPSLAAKIEAAQSVARSFDQDKSADHRPVSTVENLEAEVEASFFDNRVSVA